MLNKLNGNSLEIGIELINKIGFPIVVCVALFWFNTQSLANQTKILMDFNKTMSDNSVLLEQLSKESKERTLVMQDLIKEVQELKHNKGK